MPIVDVKPFRLSNAKLNIKSGTTDVGDFEKHVSTAQANPTTPTTEWRGLGGNVHTFAGAAGWALQLDYAQDWSQTNSLSRYLLENAGKLVTVTLTPAGGTISATNPGFRMTVMLVPGPIGGAVDQAAVGSVTLPVDGAPVVVTTP